MNGDRIRDLEMRVAALTHRLSLVEMGLTRLDAAWLRGLEDRRRRQEALGVAKELGIKAAVLTPGAATADNNGAGLSARRSLAVALRARGWSWQQLANLFGCDQRTIQRYLARGCPDSARASA